MKKLIAVAVMGLLMVGVINAFDLVGSTATVGTTDTIVYTANATQDVRIGHTSGKAIIVVQVRGGNTYNNAYLAGPSVIQFDAITGDEFHAICPSGSGSVSVVTFPPQP